MRKLYYVLSLMLFVALIGIQSCERLEEQPRPPKPCNCDLNPLPECCNPPADICDDYQYYAGGGKTKAAVTYHLFGEGTSGDGDLFQIGGASPDFEVPYIIRPNDTGTKLEWTMNMRLADLQGLGTLVHNTTDYAKGTYQRALVGDSDWNGTGTGGSTSGTETMWINGVSFNGGTSNSGSYVNIPTSFTTSENINVTVGIDDVNNYLFKEFDDFGVQKIQLSNSAGTSYSDKACHSGGKSKILMIGKGYTGSAPHMWGTGVFDDKLTLHSPSQPTQAFLDNLGLTVEEWIALFNVQDNEYIMDVAGVGSTYYLDAKAFPFNMGGSAYKNLRDVTFSITNVKVNGQSVSAGSVTAYAYQGGSGTQNAGVNGSTMTESVYLYTANGFNNLPWAGVPAPSQMLVYTITFNLQIQFGSQSSPYGDINYGNQSFTIHLKNSNLPL